MHKGKQGRSGSTEASSSSGLEKVASNPAQKGRWVSCAERQGKGRGSTSGRGNSTCEPPRQRKHGVLGKQKKLTAVEMWSCVSSGHSGGWIGSRNQMVKEPGG